MKKKIINLLPVLLFVLLVFPVSSMATSEPTDNGYNEPVVLDDFGFQAKLNGDQVDMSWNAYVPNGFNYYKVIRSTKNQDPVYPDDGYIKYSSDGDFTSYTDNEVPEGISYYRICSIAKPNRYCSNVAIINRGGVDETPMLISAKPVGVNSVVDDEHQALKDEISSLKKEVSELKQAFNDIQQHQYAVAIDYLREKAIVQGYDDGSYKPDNQINRAEFMKIVVGEKYKDELTETMTDCFSDVAKDWYSAYVCLGKNKGIIGGYDDGTFRPGQNISFVEAAKIVSNVYGLELGEEGVNWYEKYVISLQKDGYIPASVSSLSKSITRAEMAELIWRIKEQKKSQDSIKLLSDPINVSEGDYAGWSTYSGSDFTFNHPGWYEGEKWGRALLTDELDFYQNLNTPNYMDVDSYITVYDVVGTDLNTSVWFEHPFVSSKDITINGVSALMRHYRAPRGTVVSGRTTGENENITVYSYLVNGRVVVLEYFNAFGTENKNVETFYKIANSFQLK